MYYRKMISTRAKMDGLSFYPLVSYDHSVYDKNTALLIE